MKLLNFSQNLAQIGKRCNTDPNSTVRRSNLINSNANIASYPNLRPLKEDKVSFSGNGNRISDVVEAQFAKQSPRLKRIAITYLDILESVANELKDKGFSFDRAYCELNPVKSAKSYVSKIERSGSFVVPDTIRSTLYCNQAYDLDNLNALINSMKKRGYVLAETQMPVKDLIKRGYIPTANEMKNPDKSYQIVPDVDIRLEDVSAQVLKLPKNLRHSVGKPQKSGYEDIQIRFVRDFDSNESPIQHELIVLFGPKYSQAKHFESDNVYSHLRKFDELNINLEEDKNVGSNKNRAFRYVELIKQMIRKGISEKLFANAKNADLYGITEEVPIAFSDSDLGLLTNYFNGLRSRLSKCYKEEKDLVSGDPLRTKQLTSEQRQDSLLIRKIQAGLNDTIKFFNSNADSAK